ncbi:MAG: Fic family protein [Bellilinea sp.]
MNRRDFENSPAGKVIQVGQGEAEYWAFVPNPLPPNLPAEWGLTSLLSDADRAVSELAGLGRMVPNPDLFVSPFLRREAVLSSRIEGTQSDLTDLYLFEAGQMPLPGFEKPAPSEADLREVFNYVVALKFGLNRLEVLPVSLRLIKEIHGVLLRGVRGEYATPGEFRTRQNWIGGATINSSVFVPPPVPEMKIALDAFELYLHVADLYPPLLRLAFIHYQFEAIHPFVDGNGRIGRLLLSLLLVKWGILPLPLLYLSAYFEQNRQAYYDRLLATSQAGEWREWVIFFLQGVQHQALDTAKRARQIQDLQAAWREELQQSRTSMLIMRVVDLLFEIPAVSANQVARHCQVSHQSAMHVLRKLEGMGWVREITENKRNRVYLADKIVLLMQ